MEKKFFEEFPTTTLLKCLTALRFRGRKREKKGLASKLKGLRPPGPGEMVDGYFASEFHQKNFKQPLVSRARQEDQVRDNSFKAPELHFCFLFTFCKK